MIRFVFALLIFVCLFTSAYAQDAKQVFLKNVYVNGPLSLSGDAADSSTPIMNLWGVKPIDTQKQVATEVALEQNVNARPVNCTIKRWVSNEEAQAQCIGGNEVDLALSLIEQGYAMADRTVIGNTIFENLYTDAEARAIKARTGLWYAVLPEQKSLMDQGSSGQFQMTEGMAHFMIGAMIMGPFIGMLVVAIIMYGGFKRLINLQKYQMAMAAKRDRTMRQREKFIVAASLEGELNTNRAKLDAFIIIYEQMLKNLRDPLKDHKYKKGGDIIHKRPALSRNVYDSNVDKLDLLGQSLVPDITQLYMAVEPNPDYKTIEPDTPIDEVIDFVNSIIRDAESMLPLMDKISSALNVIVRDKKTQSSNV